MLALIRHSDEDTSKETWQLTKSIEQINETEDCDLIFIDHEDDALEALEEQVEGHILGEGNWFRVYELPIITTKTKYDPITRINAIENIEEIANFAKEHGKILVSDIGYNVADKINLYKQGIIPGPITNTRVREFTHDPKKAKSLHKAISTRRNNIIKKGKINTNELRCMNHAISVALNTRVSGFIKMGITFGATRQAAIKQFRDFIKLALDLGLGPKVKKDPRWQQGWNYLKQFKHIHEDEREIVEPLLKYAKSINRSHNKTT